MKCRETDSSGVARHEARRELRVLVGVFVGALGAAVAAFARLLFFRRRRSLAPVAATSPAASCAISGFLTLPDGVEELCLVEELALLEVEVDDALGWRARS